MIPIAKIIAVKDNDDLSVEVIVFNGPDQQKPLEAFDDLIQKGGYLTINIFEHKASKAQWKVVGSYFAPR